MDEGHQEIRKAHLSFQLRWAKKNVQSKKNASKIEIGAHGSTEKDF